MSDAIIEDMAEQVEAWACGLERWVDRVAPVFSRPEPREIYLQMVTGLLSPLAKKNGWTLAEHAGHTHPGRMQTFLFRGAWDASALEGHVRGLVVEEMGDPDAVLIVDDTQIIKKGVKSVGVAPQHCGATNQVENCQVVVMLTYASVHGHAFIGHRLGAPPAAQRWGRPARTLDVRSGPLPGGRDPEGRGVRDQTCTGRRAPPGGRHRGGGVRLGRW